MRGYGRMGYARHEFVLYPWKSQVRQFLRQYSRGDAIVGKKGTSMQFNSTLTGLRMFDRKFFVNVRFCHGFIDFASIF